MTKMASEGQQTYIATLIRTRIGSTETCGQIDTVQYPIPHIDFRPDTPVVVWINQLTFEEAKETLRYLVTLPEPPSKDEVPITSAQRSKCWAILKALGCNTYRAWLLRKDDPDIPHLRWEDANTSVWDWLSGLSMAEAHETIEHLEAVQKIVGRK